MTKILIQLINMTKILIQLNIKMLMFLIHFKIIKNKKFKFLKYNKFYNQKFHQIYLLFTSSKTIKYFLLYTIN